MGKGGSEGLVQPINCFWVTPDIFFVAPVVRINYLNGRNPHHGVDSRKCAKNSLSDSEPCGPKSERTFEIDFPQLLYGHYKTFGSGGFFGNASDFAVACE